MLVGYSMYRKPDCPLGKWLGWLLDLAVRCLSVPEERKQKLLKSIDKLMERSNEGSEATGWCNGPSNRGH